MWTRVFMHLQMVYSRLYMCMYSCLRGTLWPVRIKIQTGGQNATSFTFSSALCIVRKYVYLQWRIEKDGFDFLDVASGSAFLWVQSRPRSDALIGARSFVPNSISLHPWTSRNLWTRTLSHWFKSHITHHDCDVGKCQEGDVEKHMLVDQRDDVQVK